MRRIAVVLLGWFISIKHFEKGPQTDFLFKIIALVVQDAFYYHAMLALELNHDNSQESQLDWLASAS